MKTHEMAFKLILANKANLHIATVCSQIHHLYHPLDNEPQTKQDEQLYDTYENLFVFLFTQVLELLGVQDKFYVSTKTNKLYDAFEIYMLANITPSFTK